MSLKSLKVLRTLEIILMEHTLLDKLGNYNISYSQKLVLEVQNINSETNFLNKCKRLISEDFISHLMDSPAFIKNTIKTFKASTFKTNDATENQNRYEWLVFENLFWLSLFVQFSLTESNTVLIIHLIDNCMYVCIILLSRNCFKSHQIYLSK